VIALLSFVLVAPPVEWSTYRANSARTANSDGIAGPAEPRVAWVVKSSDHYIASAVPVGNNLYVAGLGGFNRPVLGLIAQADGKPVWQRSAPYLRLASVSSPAVRGNLLVFGDGMHQDAGGTLHALSADLGRPVWQHALLGELIHCEGGPAILNETVYSGAGAGGVVALQLGSATLDGQDRSEAEIAKLQNEKWATLQKAFEAAKAKDPDFAVPPTEDQLHKPVAKLLWKAGEKRWHVDAPVNAVGDAVYVCTSFLEQEKVGERALYCLDARTGQQRWTAELKLNPWGGASVLGETVVVAGSSIGYYLGQLKGAKGDLTAFDRKTGELKWRKELPGGVVGGAALADGLAVVTCTDGKIRAYDLSNGERRWLYDAKAGCFAPSAIAGGTVYAADLNGTLHAVSLNAGNAVWKFDLATDPQVKSPGAVYAGPMVHGGAVYIQTCNLEGPNAQKSTVIVKIVGK
jgi:outer membrane protein assembly factor BamB